ncbi:MAG: BON domain-containing protein [Anaerolineae bacterium]|nr:BON domain-containing protein [Anaerolineae bacterium]
MARQIDFHIGADVVCEDEQCGRVSKLVIDPHTHRVTDLVVRKGLLFTKATVVPVESVEEASEEIVQLSLPKDKLSELPEYREREYVAPPEGWKEDRFKPEWMLHRVVPGGIIRPVPVAPMIVHRVHEGISPTETVIERGLDVVGVDGGIGSVDHVLIDRETGEMKLLVVDRGLLRDDVVIPVRYVRSVTDERITVDLSEAQVDELYHYTPRSPVDILAEVKDKLSRIPVDPDSIEIELDGGILRLAGIVPNVRIKRRIVGTVWPIEGVLHVDDHLETAETIQARVMAALRSDPRTDLASIDVVARQGIVTLSGQVDSQGIKDAAGKLAAEQEGVVQVINDLEVAEDEDSWSLRLRMMARAGLSHGLGMGSTGRMQTH